MKYFAIIFFFSLIVIFPLFSRGQLSKFQLGIEGGPSLSTIRLDPLFYPSNWSENGLGYSIGLTFNYNFQKRFAFKTNLNFERIAIDNISGEPRAWWNYLVLPVLFELKMGRARHFYFDIGPYFGYVLSPPDDSWKKFDFGLSTGFGFEIPIIKQLSITTELGANLGLLNAFKSNYGGGYYTCSTNVQIGILYNFTSKGKE